MPNRVLVADRLLAAVFEPDPDSGSAMSWPVTVDAAAAPVAVFAVCAMS